MNILPFFMGAQSAPNIADLFSITLDTAANLDGVSTAGWDLLVGKSRVNATDWVWRDGAQGISDYIESNTTNAAAAFSDYATLLSAGNAVLYRFKKSPGFCDVVTYTGDGTFTQQVSHNLGVEPRMIITKATSAANSWAVYHYDGTIRRTQLSLNNAAASGGTSSGGMTDTYFTPGNIRDHSGSSPVSGGTNYVAYLFAHDTSGAGLIQQISFNTNGSGAGSYAHGWAEGVQFVGIKCVTATGDWEWFDTARSPNWTTDLRLRPNLSNAEDTVTRLSDTGGTVSFTNLSASQTYIASLIRAPS